MFSSMEYTSIPNGQVPLEHCEFWLFHGPNFAWHPVLEHVCFCLIYLPNEVVVPSAMLER